MNDREQIEAFSADLTALVARYVAEFELTTAAAVGVLEIKKHELISHALGAADDEA